MEELKTEFEPKLTNMQESHLTELEELIEAIRRTQRLIKVFTGDYIKQDHESLLRLANYDVVSAREFIYSASREEGLQELSHYCNRTTEEFWIHLGKTDQKIKSFVAELGTPVKNRYAYEDIEEVLKEIENECQKRLTALSATDKYINTKQLINDGTQEILNLFQPAINPIARKITEWRRAVVERTNCVRQSEEFEYLVTRMNAIVDSKLDELNKYLAKNSVPEGLTRCSTVKLNNKSEVIECLTKAAKSTAWNFKYNINSAIELLSAVNRELESMGY